MHDPGCKEPVADPAGRRLAVLIPVFNAQRGLDRALDSLRNEGADFEVFVVDDGSFPPLLLPEGLPFAVTLIRQPHNQGITAALNIGLKQIVARGFAYVARLDADDISLPGRLQAQMAFLDTHPDHAVVGTHVEVVDEDGHHLYVFSPPTDHESLVRWLCYENALWHPTVMMRTAALCSAGFYVDDYAGGEDYELWLRLARRYKLANLDVVFVRKEQSHSSITARRFRLCLSRLRIQLDHFAPSSIHAYLGILRSLLLLLLSRDAVVSIRRLQARWSAFVMRAGSSGRE
jgi:glycosyltransferase involved in cell wall biosynthesis